MMNCEAGLEDGMGEESVSKSQSQNINGIERLEGNQRNGTEREEENQRNGTEREGENQRNGIDREGETQRNGTEREGENQRNGIDREGETQRNGTDREEENQRNGIERQELKQRNGTAGEEENQRNGNDREGETQRNGPDREEETQRNGTERVEETQRNCTEGEEENQRNGIEREEETQRNCTEGEEENQRNCTEGEEENQRNGTEREEENQSKEIEKDEENQCNEIEEKGEKKSRLRREEENPRNGIEREEENRINAVERQEENQRNGFERQEENTIERKQEIQNRGIERREENQNIKMPSVIVGDTTHYQKQRVRVVQQSMGTKRPNKRKHKVLPSLKNQKKFQKIAPSFNREFALKWKNQIRTTVSDKVIEFDNIILYTKDKAIKEEYNSAKHRFKDLVNKHRCEILPSVSSRCQPKNSSEFQNCQRNDYHLRKGFYTEKDEDCSKQGMKTISSDSLQLFTQESRGSIFTSLQDEALMKNENFPVNLAYFSSSPENNDKFIEMTKNKGLEEIIGTMKFKRVGKIILEKIRSRKTLSTECSSSGSQTPGNSKIVAASFGAMKDEITRKIGHRLSDPEVLFDSMIEPFLHKKKLPSIPHVSQADMVDFEVSNCVQTVPGYVSVLSQFSAKDANISPSNMNNNNNVENVESHQINKDEIDSLESSATTLAAVRDLERSRMEKGNNLRTPSDGNHPSEIPRSILEEEMTEDQTGRLENEDGSEREDGREREVEGSINLERNVNETRNDCKQNGFIEVFQSETSFSGPTASEESGLLKVVDTREERIREIPELVHVAHLSNALQDSIKTGDNKDLDGNAYVKDITPEENGATILESHFSSSIMSQNHKDDKIQFLKNNSDRNKCPEIESTVIVTDSLCKDVIIDSSEIRQTTTIEAVHYHSQEASMQNNWFESEAQINSSEILINGSNLIEAQSIHCNSDVEFEILKASSSNNNNFQAAMTSQEISSNNNNFQAAMTSQEISSNSNNFQAAMTSQEISSNNNNFQAAMTSQEISSNNNNFQAAMTSQEISSNSNNFQAAMTSQEIRSNNNNFQAAMTSQENSSNNSNGVFKRESFKDKVNRILFYDKGFKNNFKGNNDIRCNGVGKKGSHHISNQGFQGNNAPINKPEIIKKIVFDKEISSESILRDPEQDKCQYDTANLMTTKSANQRIGEGSSSLGNNLTVLDIESLECLSPQINNCGMLYQENIHENENKQCMEHAIKYEEEENVAEKFSDSQGNENIHAKMCEENENEKKKTGVRKDWNEEIEIQNSIAPKYGFDDELSWAKRSMEGQFVSPSVRYYINDKEVVVELRGTSIANHSQIFSKEEIEVAHDIEKLIKEEGIDYGLYERYKTFLRSKWNKGIFKKNISRTEDLMTCNARHHEATMDWIDSPQFCSCCEETITQESRLKDQYDPKLLFEPSNGDSNLAENVAQGQSWSTKACKFIESIPYNSDPKRLCTDSRSNPQVTDEVGQESGDTVQRSQSVDSLINGEEDVVRETFRKRYSNLCANRGKKRLVNKTRLRNESPLNEVKSSNSSRRLSIKNRSECQKTRSERSRGSKFPVRKKSDMLTRSSNNHFTANGFANKVYPSVSHNHQAFSEVLPPVNNAERIFGVTESNARTRNMVFDFLNPFKRGYNSRNFRRRAPVAVKPNPIKMTKGYEYEDLNNKRRHFSEKRRNSAGRFYIQDPNDKNNFLIAEEIGIVYGDIKKSIGAPVGTKKGNRVDRGMQTVDINPSSKGKGALKREKSSTSIISVKDANNRKTDSLPPKKWPRDKSVTFMDDLLAASKLETPREKGDYVIMVSKKLPKLKSKIVSFKEAERGIKSISSTLQEDQKERLFGNRKDVAIGSQPRHFYDPSYQQTPTKGFANQNGFIANGFVKGKKPPDLERRASFEGLTRVKSNNRDDAPGVFYNHIHQSGSQPNLAQNPSNGPHLTQKGPSDSPSRMANGGPPGEHAYRNGGPKKAVWAAPKNAVQEKSRDDTAIDMAFGSTTDLLEGAPAAKPKGSVAPPIVMLQGIFNKAGAAKGARNQKGPANAISNQITLPKTLLEPTSLLRGALPVLPTYLAGICLFFNIFIPGLGTIMSGLLGLCTGRSRLAAEENSSHKWKSAIITGLTGMIQMFTVSFFLVGWFWSISWGIILVSIARKYNKFLVQQKIAANRKVGFDMLAINTE